MKRDLRDELKELVEETKKCCLIRCNSCNNKSDLLVLLFEYYSLTKEYKKHYIDLLDDGSGDIACSVYFFIKYNVYKYFIKLIEETIRRIDDCGLSLSFINHFERYSFETIDILIREVYLM